MSRHVRIRCPVCGMLVWQKGLAKEHEFEVKIQNIFSRGRGKISHTYSTPTDQDGVWIIKLALIDKLRAVADQLEGEAKEERRELWSELIEDGEIGVALNLPNEMEFREVWTSVSDGGGLVDYAYAKIKEIDTGSSLLPARSQVHEPEDAIEKYNAPFAEDDVVASAAEIGVPSRLAISRPERYNVKSFREKYEPQRPRFASARLDRIMESVRAKTEVSEDEETHYTTKINPGENGEI